MGLLPATSASWEQIERFSSRRASTTRRADGSGEAHAPVVRIDAGGIIGRHPAGFGQLWIVVARSGWVAGGDGRRSDVRVGDAAFIERGERHAKGSDAGMTAVTLQVYGLEPMPGIDASPGTSAR